MAGAAVLAATLVSAQAAVDPGVKRLGKAVDAYEKRDYFTAVHLLTESGQPAKLRDYVAYYLANAELVTNNGGDAVRDLGRYVSNPVAGSPLTGRLSLLYAKALLGQSTPTPADALKARQILESQAPLLPQPDGDFTDAQAMEATGFPRQAAVNYQRVYFLFPASPYAEQALAALGKLRDSLGADYPQAPGRLRLERGKAWLALRQYTRARQEFAMLADDLTGADREEAQAGVGAALYLGGDEAGAVSYLEKLSPENPEAGAERLYYLTEAYRKLDDDSGMMTAVRELEERYPASPWRLKALVTAGNRYLLTQDRDHYVPLYRAVAETFPADSAAPLSHWRVAWAAWLDHSPQREELLREQVEKFPNDTHVSDALFFLGREAERQSNFGAARAYYEALSTQFPHYYYAGLARDRLETAKVAGAKLDDTVRAWVDKATGAHANSIPDDIGMTANAATRRRIERGRLLIAAGMTTQAVDELEYGARQSGEQATLLAMELSRSMPTPYLALRVMKKFSGDYLSLPFDKASRSFWEMLFPMPYEQSMTSSAEKRDLDPYAVAGLIRQESEFNPAARSAYAYGLMQVRPSTGRMMARREGIRAPSARRLLEPSLNIRLGTRYLRGQLDQWDGDWVKTLAAYNAGPSRVKRWVEQYGYDDPAEFVENIPFSETRDYVQAVLRNGQVYRDLYGKQKAVLADEVKDDSDIPAGKIDNVTAASKKVMTKQPRRISVSRRKAAAKKAASKKAASKASKRRAAPDTPVSEKRRGKSAVEPKKSVKKHSAA
ncbi:MAG TPA: transglycosylase SLT domain-containing protein [Bryobacteraceae bacterium]|nr:transglycosylase SLT domain-containing protein [Bryobacteraceae bacterium]